MYLVHSAVTVPLFSVQIIVGVTFWSVGGKWRVSGEEFLKDNSIITNATLRASYGTVGNQDIDWYAARGFYSSGYNYNEKPGMTPTSISNSDLTWDNLKKI